MLGLVLGLFAVFTATIRAEFAFEKEDHICLVGNTLADRFQHDGWLETLLQSGNPDLQLIFRNQAFPGDTVTKRPRSQGFKSVEDYLAQ